MSTTVTMNSVVYTVPTADEVDWASQELTWKQGVASNVNTGISSAVTLTNAVAAVVAEVNVIQAVAPNPAIMAFSANVLPTANGTYYLRPYAYGGTADGSEVQVPVPVAGVAAKLYVQGFLAIADGSYQFTVRKNGTDTTLLTAITDGTQNSYDIVNSFSIAAGDLLSVSVIASGVTTGTGTVYATLVIKAA